MKIKKVLSLFAITAFLLTSCSSDDNEIIRPEQKDQVEVSKESPVLGDYSFNHAGNPIPFHFEKTTITMKMSGMAGSGQDDEIFNVITTYKNAEGVLKTVAKNKDNNEYKAFFFRDIKDDKSTFLLNTDLSTSSEIEAIKAAYPAKDIVVDHGAGQFGWLPMTKGAIVEPILLPINGKYSFSATTPQGTFSYYYDFSNDVINFSGDYNMTVLAHNKNTNKILLVGKDEKVKDFYYVIQLKNIVDNKVDVARLTYKATSEGLTPKQQAEKEFASQEEIKANFTTYTKDEGTNNTAFANLKGSYVTEKMGPTKIGYYTFRMGEDKDAFLFVADMAGSGEFKESASFNLERVFADEKSGQLIYKVISAKGYYEGREGQYLTFYVKDITADGSKATFAIATKQVKDDKGNLLDSNSILKSKGDVVGKTLEEAKSIKAPEANKVFVPKEGMMKYAHLWIPTTRE